MLSYFRVPKFPSSPRMARPQRKTKRAAPYLDYLDGSDEDTVEEEEEWKNETMKVAKFFDDEDDEEYAPMPTSIKKMKRKLKSQEKSEDERVDISLVDANANNVTDDGMKEGKGGSTDARTQDIPDPRPTPSGDITGTFLSN